MANLSSMSSAQIVSASSIHRPNVNIFPTPGIAHNVVPMGHMFTSGPGECYIKCLQFVILNNEQQFCF